jgi:hypothetical protein
MSRLLFLLIFLGSNALFAQNTILEFPENFQLFTRNKQDLATVAISLETKSTILSYSLIVKQGDKLFTYFSSVNNANTIQFSPTIHAELSEYSFQLYEHSTKKDSSIIASADKVLCGDAYVFYGQSNAAGGQSTTEVQGLISDKYIRSYRYTPNVPGNPSYWNEGHHGAQNMGVFAISFANEIVQNNKYPVAIINAAQGGLSISGLNDRVEREINYPNTTYGLMLSRIQKSKIKSIKSLIWLQGENESNSDASTVNKYPEEFLSLYNNIFKDLPILESFTIVQVNILGDIPFVWESGKLRDFQRNFGGTLPKTYLLATAGISENDGIHYHTDGYIKLGKHLHVLANNKFYGAKDNVSVTAPNIQKIEKEASLKRIKLTFDTNQVFAFDTVFNFSNYSRNLKDFIYNGRNTGFIKSISYDKNIIYIYYKYLTDGTLTYLPPKFNDSYSPSYNGPTFKNSKGLHAATFFEFPITPDSTEVIPPEIESSIIDRTKTKVIFNLYPKVSDCDNCKVVINQLVVSNNELIKTGISNLDKNNCYFFNAEHPGRNNRLNFELYYVSTLAESEKLFYSLDLSPIRDKAEDFKTFPTSVYQNANNSITVIQGYVLNDKEFLTNETMNCSNFN